MPISQVGQVAIPAGSHGRSVSSYSIKPMLIYDILAVAPLTGHPCFDYDFAIDALEYTLLRIR